jgi:GNAT superfamily N-acetyltransferase
MSYSILKADPEELKTLDQAITDFNIKIAPELPRAELHRLDFTMKNPMGQLLGGIQSYWVNWGILHVESIYVYDDYRNQGIATALLSHIEKIVSLRRACVKMCLKV